MEVHLDNPEKMDAIGNEIAPLLTPEVNGDLSQNLNSNGVLRYEEGLRGIKFEYREPRMINGTTEVLNWKGLVHKGSPNYNQLYRLLVKR